MSVKFSISVPDDLWASVNDDDAAGPSEVVQRGLRALLDQKQEESRPMANAPNQTNLKAYERQFSTAVDAVASTLQEVLDRGYRCGLAIAAGMTMADFDLLDDPANAHRALQQMVFAWGDTDQAVDEDPENFSSFLYAETETWLNEDPTDLLGDPDYERVKGVVWKWNDELDKYFPMVSDAFARGAVAGLRDVRDQSLRQIHQAPGTPSDDADAS